MASSRNAGITAAVAMLVLGLMVVAQSATATHVRPKAATPFYASTVPAYVPCTSPNRTHAAPLSFPSCNPPVQASPNVTVGTPDANGAPANSTGFVKMVVTNGAGPTDADVAVNSTITDVRCQGATTACGTTNTIAGPDYVGALTATASLQITDHNNNDPNIVGDPFDDPATGTQPSFPMVLACVNTANTIGASCSMSTTVNTLAPGALLENKRNLVEISQLQVLDGGPDGTPATGNEALFAVQGIFIP